GGRQDGFEGGVGMRAGPQAVAVAAPPEEGGRGRQDRHRIRVGADRERRVDDDRGRVIAGDEEDVLALLEPAARRPTGEMPPERDEIRIDEGDQAGVVHRSMVPVGRAAAEARVGYSWAIV